MRRIRLVPDGTKIPFMRWSRLGMLASAVLVLASLVAAYVPGLNFGIDFRGGILVEVQTPGPADIGRMRQLLGELDLGDVSLQEFGQPNDVLIRVVRQEGGEGGQAQAIEAVRQALQQEYGSGLEYRRIEYVGPQVSRELIEAGLIAVSVAMALMLAYIWFRFEWHFGVGAVLALLHDVALAVGLLAVTQIDFNLSTIAALLAIVGYSINDTVVVYDRVRENTRRYKTMPLAGRIDLSVNDTLARTTMTSFTTLLALGALYLLGGEVIRPFVFTMLWGIVIGTYSSIFIAAPVLLLLGLDRSRPAGSGADDGRKQARGA